MGTTHLKLLLATFGDYLHSRANKKWRRVFIVFEIQLHKLNEIIFLIDLC